MKNEIIANFCVNYIGLDEKTVKDFLSDDTRLKYSFEDKLEGKDIIWMSGEMLKTENQIEINIFIEPVKNFQNKINNFLKNLYNEKDLFNRN